VAFIPALVGLQDLTPSVPPIRVSPEIGRTLGRRAGKRFPRSFRRQYKRLPAGCQGSVAGAEENQGPYGLYPVHVILLRGWRGTVRRFEARCVGHDAPAGQRTGAPDIRVNGVAPSGTVTNLRTAPSLAGNNQAAASVFGTGRSAGPANNLLELSIAPEDHAAAYVLLASSQSKTMTGTVLHTDAGRGVTTFSGR
jgi:Enoyl-(Acyl carrier protein) reductase